MGAGEGSTEEREPCARGGVQACVQRRRITTYHGSPLRLIEYEIEQTNVLNACSNNAEDTATFSTTLTAEV